MTQRMIDAELILLAHMIGDGSCIKRQPVRYASIDEQEDLGRSQRPQHILG